MFTSKNRLSSGQGAASPWPMSLSPLPGGRSPAHDRASPCGGPDALHRTLATGCLALGAGRIHPRQLHQQGLRRDILYLQWQTWLMGWILPAALTVATGCGAAACWFSSQGITLPHTCPVSLLPARLIIGRDLAPFGDKNQSAGKRATHEPKTPGAVSYLKPQARQVQR